MKWLSLHVGGQRWAVHLVRGTDKRLGDPEEGCDGITEPDKCRITLSKDIDVQAREDALVHELFHATIYVSGACNALFEACGRDQATFDRVEEQIVRCLTPTWHRLLKDLGFHFPKGPTE